MTVSTQTQSVSKTAASAKASAMPNRATLLKLYETMMLLRRFELAVQGLYKAGKLPGFGHLYVGEEAVATGICAHLTAEDWITSTHRGHGHALAKGLDPRVLMAELNAKATGCCGGRGGSMHLYDAPVGLFGTNGLVGAGIPMAVGAAISAKVRGTQQVAVAFFGDGAVNHGTFHEAINFATAQDAPAIFVCENNLYATATPLTMTTRNTDVASKAAAYGLPGVAVDGNDVLAMWSVAREAVARARAGRGPTLIEARTYRVVGHHEGDQLYGTYRTKEEVEQWKLKDPILALRKRLTEEMRISPGELDAIDASVEQRVQEAADFGQVSPDPEPATADLHVFADPINPPIPAAPPSPAMQTQGWLEAVRDGIAEEMRRDQHIIYLGEGIGERGGSFAHTKNLWQEFTGQRVIDTPIAELGFTGAAIGASATGCRAVADLMFADFLFEAASQIIHQASKLRYMSNGRMSVPVVILAGSGEVRSAGPHHSGSYHPIWSQVPGLIVAIPSNPADAKGLIKTALRASDPVIFLEHKTLFSTKGEVPAGEHLVPFGVASIARRGTDLTIVSAGLLVHRSLEAAVKLEAVGVSCEVIDLRTIVPLDVQTVVESVSRTHRLLVVDEGQSMCGIGGELAATMMELAFDELDAPVGRLHTHATTYPFSPVLEREVIVTVDKIVDAAQAVVAGEPRVERRVSGRGRTAGPAQQYHPAVPAPSPVPAGTAAGIPVEKLGPISAPPKGAPAAAPLAAGTPLTMPHGDLTISEGKVTRWLKQVGDAVRLGEPVVEVETEKAVTEIESPAAGVLVQIVTPNDTVVAMGATLGVIGSA